VGHHAPSWAEPIMGRFVSCSSRTMLFAWLSSYIKRGGATRLGVQKFRQNIELCCCMEHPPGTVLSFIIFNKDCCEGSCAHQGLSGSGLRHVDYLHVACWIRSSSSSCVLHVIGRLLSGLTRSERSGQNSRIIGVIDINSFTSIIPFTYC
jgi:hypothetical protein